METFLSILGGFWNLGVNRWDLISAFAAGWLVHQYGWTRLVSWFSATPATTVVTSNTTTSNT